MKRKMLSLMLFILVVIFMSNCTMVPVGYEGIKVKDWGTYKGVQELPAKTGKITYNPFTETVYKYPTFLKSYPYSQDKRQGSEDDEAIRFSDSQGLTFTADVGLAYKVIAGKSPYVFWFFRKDIDELTDGYIREQLQNSFVKYGSSMSAQQILGSERNKLLMQVLNRMNDEVAFIEVENKDNIKERVKAFEFFTISFLSNPRPPDDVMDSINRVIQANNIRLEQITLARGDSLSAVIRATGQAKANQLLNQSITPTLVDYMRAENWRPLAIGSNTILPLK